MANDLQFTVVYKGKTYTFQYGSQAYIFHTAILNGVKSVKKLQDIVEAVQAAYLKDDNRTPLGALADYVAKNWYEVKDLSSSKVLEKFYEEEGF